MSRIDSYHSLGQLNAKQQKLFQNLLNGMEQRAALKDAGFSTKSLQVITRLGKLLRETLEQRQKKMIEETISKSECIAILKKIAMQSDSEKNKIAAIQTISKMFGYDAPVKSENKNDNIVTVKFEEEDGKDN
jgi:hypothetical protein